MRDGDLDCSAYTRRELNEALAAIDQEQYPKNFQKLLEAIAKPLPAVETSSQAPSTAVMLLPASAGRRLANCVIDQIAILGMAIVAMIILMMIFGPSVERALKGPLEYLLGYGVSFIYYASLEMLTGTTLGKLVTRTVVVSENGETPTKLQFFLRSLSRFIPFEPFSFLGEDNRGWHDTLSRTYVIRLRDR